MSTFSLLLQCQNKSELQAAFKQAAQFLDAEQLNLQQVVSQGSMALNEDIEVMLLATEQNDQQLIIKAGIFYRSLIAGCNCADDPSPVDTLQEYCEARFIIDRQDGSYAIKFD